MARIHVRLQLEHETREAIVRRLDHTRAVAVKEAPFEKAKFETRISHFRFKGRNQVPSSYGSTGFNLYSCPTVLVIRPLGRTE
jgi:hypothetical protein